jgi:hypothetical protein
MVQLADFKSYEPLKFGVSRSPLAIVIKYRDAKHKEPNHHIIKLERLRNQLSEENIRKYILKNHKEYFPESKVPAAYFKKLIEKFLQKAHEKPIQINQQDKFGKKTEPTEIIQQGKKNNGGRVINNNSSSTPMGKEPSANLNAPAEYDEFEDTLKSEDLGLGKNESNSKNSEQMNFGKNQGHSKSNLGDSHKNKSKVQPKYDPKAKEKSASYDFGDFDDDFEASKSKSIHKEPEKTPTPKDKTPQAPAQNFPALGGSRRQGPTQPSPLPAVTNPPKAQAQTFPVAKKDEKPKDDYDFLDDFEDDFEASKKSKMSKKSKSKIEKSEDGFDEVDDFDEIVDEEPTPPPPKKGLAQSEPPVVSESRLSELVSNYKTLDLNKLSVQEVTVIKKTMDQEFKQLKPGDPGYVYDKEVEFGNGDEDNDWDD